MLCTAMAARGEDRGSKNEAEKKEDVMSAQTTGPPAELSLSPRPP